MNVTAKQLIFADQIYHCCFFSKIHSVCDVICENVAFCGINSFVLDKLFETVSHICDSIFIHTAFSDNNIFCRCSKMTNIAGPDQTRVLRLASDHILR